MTCFSSFLTPESYSRSQCCCVEVVLALREAEVCLVTAERVSDGSSL